VIDGSLSDVAADRIYAEYLREYERAWSLFPDVLPCLDRLSTHRLGIISNGMASEQMRKLVNMGIDARFQAIVISGDCGYAKPSAEIFELGCGDKREAGQCHLCRKQLRVRCSCRSRRGTAWCLDRSIRRRDRTPCPADHQHPGRTPLLLIPAFARFRVERRFALIYDTKCAR
jgi:hypothetical protein